MNNNDIFKKLRVALQLRDDEIVDILQLVDFRISKGEIGNIFRNEDHEKFMVCGDQVLRNFLNGLVIHLRGTRENPVDTKAVLAAKKASAPKFDKPKFDKPKPVAGKPASGKPAGKPSGKAKPAIKNPTKAEILGQVKFNNGKNKKA